MTDKHTLVERLLDDASDQPYTERHEAATRITALEAEKAELVEALNDLVSWFPEKPTDPEWRLRGGERGADDAVTHARATLAKHQEEPTP